MAAILDAPQTFTKGAGDIKLEALKKAGNVAIAVAVVVELNNCSWSRRTGTLAGGGRGGRLGIGCWFPVLGRSPTLIPHIAPLSTLKE